MPFASTQDQIPKIPWNGLFRIIFWVGLLILITGRCNARYVIIGDEVFVAAIKPIKKGEEIFVYYKIR